MARKNIVHERHLGCVLQHVGSNLKFAIDGSCGWHIIENTLFMGEGTALNVCDTFWVGCWYEGEIVKFYVQDVREIPELYKLVDEAGVQDPHVGMTVGSFNDVVDTLGS